MSKFSTDHAAAIPQVVSVLRQDYDVQCCYATGSIVAGYGNASSDLDLTLIASEAALSYTRDFVFDDFTCDVRIHSLAEMRQFIARLSDAVAHDDYQSVLDGNKWLPHVDRLLRGWSVDGVEVHEKLRSEVDVNRLRQLTVTHHTLVAITYVGDSFGALCSGDHLTGLDTSAEALRLATLALAAARGDTYFGAKFFRRRMFVPGFEQAVAIPAAEALIDPAPQVALDIVEDKILSRLALAGAISTLAGLFGWDTPFAAEPDEVAAFVRSWTSQKPSRWRADRFSAVAPLDDGVLIGGGVGYFVSRPVALCYALAPCVGSESDLAKAFERVTGLPPTREFVSRAIEGLVGAGKLGNLSVPASTDPRATAPATPLME